MTSLNAHLLACCHRLGRQLHPDNRSQTIDEVFAAERGALRPVGRGFDGYVEKTVRVSSTCLVHYDTVRYSVPCAYAKQRVSLRAYADKVVVVAKQSIIATHQRSFDKHDYQFEPWHYVPLLTQKPGAIRDGAPFKDWQLPESVQQIKKAYLKRKAGDRDFVELLQHIQTYGIELVSVACELSLEHKVTQHAALTNLIYRLAEPEVETQLEANDYPQITVLPEANCQRYEQLLDSAQVTV